MSMTTRKDCIVCNSAENKRLYDDILKCKRCGHVFYAVELSDDRISELYGKKYFFGDEYSDYTADRKVLEKNFRLRLNTLSNFLDRGRHRSLLEIGCAYGFFLNLAKERIEAVRGIDLNKEAVLYAREKLRLDAVNCDFLKYDFSGQKFDVVCMWDTIEHLRDPHLYLKKASEHMDSGSLLAMTTGDIGSLNARIKKEKWRLLHPPTHIHYFSKKTLERLMDVNGFDIIYNQHCGFYRSVDMAAYRILALRKRRNWLYNFLRGSGITGLNFYLNLYDIMYVIARKR